MAWLPRQLPPKSFGDAWHIEPFGALNHYEVTLDPKGSNGSEYLTGTGAAAYVYMDIPYPHRWVRMEFKHQTTANVDSAVAHLFYLERSKWSGRYFKIYGDAASVVADDMRIAGDGYEYPAGKYRVYFNVAEGYILLPEFTVQILGKPFDETKYGSKKGPEWH